MIRAEVAKSLGSFALELQIAAPARGVTALFGASGAGKSTALALLAGALRPDRGRIELDGEVLDDVAAGLHRPLEQRRIGWVFQDGRLFPHLRVAQNLDYGARRAAARESSAVSTAASTTAGSVQVTRDGSAALSRERVIEVLGIGSLLQRWPRELSGGERQRVAIGRALLARPRLLLLDEPLASLDAPRKAEILAFLERVKAEFGIPTVYVTHSLAEVLRLADHLVLLEQGRVVAQGALRELVGRGDTPLLAARSDSGALLECTVDGHDPVAGTTRLALDTPAGGAPAAGGTHDDTVDDPCHLSVPMLRAAPGERVRAYVLANEVIVATELPRGLSVRNVLAAGIRRIVARADGSALVELEAGGHDLLAALTQGAVRDLGLEPGKRVWALIKSVAIDAPAGSRALLED